MDWLMKNRLYLDLMANKEKGFALPLALLIGLILMGTGITMMMRAQGDQSKVVAQKARADSLASAEAGVARVQDLLNSVRVMAKFPSHCKSGEDCWQTAEVATNPSTELQKDLKKLAIATACGNDSRKDEIANKILAPTNQRAENPGLRDLTTGEWFDLGNNRYYRMVGYNFTPKYDPKILGWGYLTLEGRSRTSPETDLTKTNIDRDSDDNAASRNRVVVTIHIVGSLPPAFNRSKAPALWINKGATEDADQTSQMKSNAEYSGGAKFEGDVVMSDTTFDKGTLQPELECFINTNKIQQPKPALDTPYKAQFVDESLPSLPKIPDNVPDKQRDLKLSESKTIFPRTDGDGNITDTTSTRKINDQDVEVYEYIFDSIDLNDREITITPGERVIFYVRQDITGNGGIEHDCSTVSSPTVCKAGNLQIYAYNQLASDSAQICLKGSKKLEAFIFAPNYSLGKNGSGAFVGAAWGKDWGKKTDCGSNNDAVAVTQGVEWTDLLIPKPGYLKSLPRVGKIASWCQEPIPENDDTPTEPSKCVPD